MSAAKRSAQDAVLDALTAEGNRTVGELVDTAAIGRSAAGKALAALEQAGKVQRSVGGREGARRLPDRWSLAVADEPSTPGARPNHVAARAVTGDGPADEKAEQDGISAGAHTATEPSSRLRPGQLDGLVLDYLAAHRDEGPVGPGTVAKALGRSSGAVGNCLARLASAGRVRLVDEHPRRFVFPVFGGDHSRSEPASKTS